MTKTAYNFIYVSFLLVLLSAACSEYGPQPAPADGRVEIFLEMGHYTKVIVSSGGAAASATRATDDEIEAAESEIEDLYLFLFPGKEGQTLKKYHITHTSGAWNIAEIGGGAGGSYVAGEKKITLNLSQAEAGTREVYIVANCGQKHGDIISMNTVEQLKGIYLETGEPWSPNLTTPIPLSGNRRHNFIENRVLGSGGANKPLALVRAFAKVELNITLKKEHQGAPKGVYGPIGGAGGGTESWQYNYALLNFEKETYWLSPNGKKAENLAHPVNDPVVIADLEPSLWTPWKSGKEQNNRAFYTLSNEGKVQTLKLVTYMNEKMTPSPRSFIAISMPYEGELPPPEFGPDLSGIYLPQMKRNYWYVYDIEM